MIWLFPLYLLGAGAVIGPILMHLRKKPPQNTMEFSSLMFLDAQTPVPVTKRRLEHWLLLLLRCAALLLLVLMFARPLWRNAKALSIGQGGAIAILVDQSASMRRADLWKQAVARADKLIQGAAPEDRINVATFDGSVHSLWSFDEDKTSSSNRVAAIRQRLGQAHPGWGGTDIGKALREMADAFSNAASMAGRKKRIVLISDLQEGAKLEMLRGLVWPENIKLSLQKVDAPNSDNLSLALAANAPETGSGAKTGEQASGIRVRITNSRDSKVSDFRLSWENTAGEVLAGYLPPGASRVLTAPPLTEGMEGKTLRLTGDAWDFDNRVYVAPLQPKPVRIVFIGDERTRDETATPLYYLSRALQSTAALAPELLVIPTTAKALPPGSSIAFAGGTPVSESLVAALRTFMENGGLCVKMLDSSTDTSAAQAALRRLTGSADLSMSRGEVPTGGYRMLSEVDGTHILLRPFADERLRDFTKLRFWKYQHLELGAKTEKDLKVIARFDNGDPAILARDIGKGHLVLLSFGWDPRESQLALSTKFVPLLYGWMEAAGFRNDALSALLVGDALPADAGAKVLTPDQQILTVPADAPLRAEMTGLYSITPAKGGRTTLYAANLPPEEGRITPLDPNLFLQLGLSLELDGKTAHAAANADKGEHLGIQEEEKQQHAWVWILAVVLLVLAAETWLANRLRPSGEMKPAEA